MKTTIIGICLITSIISFGQNENFEPRDNKLSVTEKAEKRTEKMSKLLNLTEEQEAKVYQVNLSHIEKMEEIRLEKNEIRDKVKSSHDSVKEELEKILSKEQLEIIEKQRDERKRKHQEKKECVKEKCDK